LPCPPLGDLPEPGIKPASLAYPALGGGFFITSSTWEAATRAAGHKGRDQRENPTPGLSNSGSFLNGFNSVWPGQGTRRSGCGFQARCRSLTSYVNMGKSLHFQGIYFSIKQNNNTFLLKVVWK